MTRGPTIKTDRLLLRRWRQEDLEPFAALNSDPVVMEHFPAPMTLEESARLIERCEDSFERLGLGMWAVEHVPQGTLIGICGLFHRDFDAPFTPAVDVGWRFARSYWGSGYATEAARASVGFGFDELGLAEIVSFTVPANHRSVLVMERLGMTRDPEDDFDHPHVETAELRRHVLYRIDSGRWSALNSG